MWIYCHCYAVLIAAVKRPQPPPNSRQPMRPHMNPNAKKPQKKVQCFVFICLCCCNFSVIFVSLVILYSHLSCLLLFYQSLEVFVARSLGNPVLLKMSCWWGCCKVYYINIYFIKPVAGLTESDTSGCYYLLVRGQLLSVIWHSFETCVMRLNSWRVSNLIN